VNGKDSMNLVLHQGGLRPSARGLASFVGIVFEGAVSGTSVPGIG
jgi:hypothetical protein